MKKIICLLLVLILNIAGCSYLKIENLHNNDSDNDTNIQNIIFDIQTNEEDEPKNIIPKITDDDFTVSDNNDEIILDTRFSDFKTSKTELSNNYVGEIWFEKKVYVFYSYYYGDFTIYASNAKHDKKNRSGNEYYISQIDIYTPEMKTYRGLSIGNTIK